MRIDYREEAEAADSLNAHALCSPSPALLWKALAVQKFPLRPAVETLRACTKEMRVMAGPDRMTHPSLPLVLVLELG